MIRVGQDHWRAKLTDREVYLIRVLLGEARTMVAEMKDAGCKRGRINNALNLAGLSHFRIAQKFDVSKTLIRAIAHERVRIWSGPACAAEMREGVGA